MYNVLVVLLLGNGLVAGEEDLLIEKKLFSCGIDGETGACTRECLYKYYGLTFDLAGLRRPEHYSISLREGLYDTQYAFGVCRNINEPVASCASTRGSADVLSDPAAAYQILRGGDECFRCGSANFTTWGLVNELRPAEGVWVRYDGGNTCDNAASPTLTHPCTDIIHGHTYCRRSLTVKFICDDRASSVPTLSDQVREEAGCAYTIVLNSQYGCPTQCPRNINDGLVCSGHGVCAYDGIYSGKNAQDKPGTVGCNCDLGWTGSACDIPDEDEYSGYHYTIFVYRHDNFILALGLSTMFIGFASLAFACRGKLLAFLSGVTNLARDSTNHRKRKHHSANRGQTLVEINKSHGRYQTEDLDIDIDSSNPFLAGGSRFSAPEPPRQINKKQQQSVQKPKRQIFQIPSVVDSAHPPSDEEDLLTYTQNTASSSYNPDDPLGGLSSL